MKTILAWLVVGPLIVSIGPGSLHSERLPMSSGGTKVQIYSHDAKGLQRQFEPFLKSVAKGDEAQIRESFGVFALPNPETWFARYFAKDQIQQLVWDDESEVEGYRNTLTMFLRRFLKGSYYSVHCEPNNGAGTTLNPRADAILPLTQIPIEKYTVKFSGEGGHSMEQLVNFAYVDGAFRYLGKGSYPFWSMPDATSKPSQ